MDALTHIVVGLFIGIYLAGKMRFEDIRLPIVAGILGGILPDMDAISGLMGKGGFFLLHRAVTHSLLSAAIIAIITALILARLRRGNIHKFAIIAFASLMAHLAVDLFTLPGIALFYPFSTEFFTLGFMPPVDILLLVTLGAGLVVAEVLPHKTIRVSGMMLIIITLFFATKFAVYEFAETRVEKYDGFGESLIVPHFFNPLEWRVVAENPDSYLVAEYGFFTGMKDVAELKKDMNTIVEYSKASRVVQGLIKISECPFAVVDENSVRWFDLKFSNDGSIGYTARVIFDSNMRIIEEEAGF